ncbi:MULTISPECIES: DeoR/GlpR family DNA-binding transcription regulator [Bacillaceae]|uniref:DeoR/GlpR family DNA-binding transcription regulator n=1 Tax=Bacillaceae TaxID=186817 RepID=UPI000C778A4E|nr:MULTISPECIES: DeoR/GlpR family DNA-binding transcription regulator [Bacillaceae]PLR66426.1 DeoR/GlpR transcriptional regulator [Bacillus sp. UMB0893]
MFINNQQELPWVGNERQVSLIKLVEEAGTIRVSDMSKRFNVTEETIRRDFERLEKEGFLTRIHGGAISFKKNENEVPVLKRQGVNIEEKQAIAYKAATFVEDGDIISLDASTTALQMTKYLVDKEITVITNSMSVTLELAKNPSLTVITVGGYLLEDSMSFVGTSSEKVIEDYHVDKYFFSCTGFDVERGISEVNEQQAQIKKKFLSISDKLYLLSDYSKYGQKSLVRLTNLNKIDYLITDDKMAVNDLRTIRNTGINTIVAD